VFSRIEAIAARGVSLVIVDQNATQALRLADQVCVVSQGRVVYQAPKEQAIQEVNIVDAHLGLASDGDAVQAADANPSATDLLVARPTGRRRMQLLSVLRRGS
jgi:ABC-type sugar transport system ATPase subunit